MEEDCVLEEAEDQETRQGVLLRHADEALRLWVRWHVEAGSGGRWLPRGLDRPSAPYGSPVAFQAAALVEGTAGFLLVERRLRAAYGMAPARDALPEVYPSTPTALAIMALPLFLAVLQERLPVELFPPEVVAGRDLLPEDRAAQKEIEDKYRGRYPASWRRS